ncbi:MAG: hypothetical protein JJV92_01525 [Desulfosarcina sp.]|nr:hypothetical protein [Desulfobacterales bacterium]
MTIQKWLHVSEFGGNYWVTPVWAAIKQAEEKGCCSEITADLRELGINISTRFAMLPRIIKRINFGWKTLYEKVQNFSDDNIFERGSEKRAYAIQVDDDLIYPLLLDIDSFFFETNSCSELMGLFLHQIYLHQGMELTEKRIGLELKKILSQNGQDFSWFLLLDKERNLFIHKVAPYIAIDISSTSPDLIIMKENLHSFDDPKSFTLLSELDKIVNGFSEASMILQEHIIKLYNSLSC